MPNVPGRLGVRVLIAGVSTRAAAESAWRAGYDVTSLDAFGDTDQHPGVRALSLPRDFGVRFAASAAARVASNIDCDAVAYLSSFENHPGAVRALAAGRMLWGNGPSVLRRVRDPLVVARVLAERGVATPRCHPEPPLGHPAPPLCHPAPPLCHPAPPLCHPERSEGSSMRHSWPATSTGEQIPRSLRSLGMTRGLLLKPRASGGGHGIRVWQPGETIPRGHYLQEYIEGTPGSIVFASARGRALPLGFSRQLVGDEAFGASEFRYCGNILAPASDPQFTDDATLASAACALAGTVAEEFGLAGVNGIDFVARDGVPYPVEINPRYSASMELVERAYGDAYGVSVFGVHAAACTTGELPDFDMGHARAGCRAFGKAIVFARHDVVCGDTHPWLDDASVRDVPHPGEHIAAGRPVCTVFAEAQNSSECHAALVRRADEVYEALGSWSSVAA